MPATDDPWADAAADWDDDEGPTAYARLAHRSLTEVLTDHGVAIEGATVCDFGCGTGLLTELMVDHAARIDAVDTSPAMLARLDDKIRRRGWTTVSTSPDLPPATGGHDLVVCSSVLSFVDDLPATVRSLTRLLRPGGVLVQWDWERTEPDGHGLTADEIHRALAGAGLLDVRVEPAFEITIEDVVVRPLRGSGRTSR